MSEPEREHMYYPDLPCWCGGQPAFGVPHRDSTGPQRIQLKRTHGYRMPEGAVSVARPTRWGNPFKPGDALKFPFSNVFGPVVRDRLHAVAVFACHASCGSGYAGRAQRDLAGKSLACWCPLPEPGQPDICHGAVLLAVSNGDEREAARQSEHWWRAVGAP